MAAAFRRTAYAGGVFDNYWSAAIYSVTPTILLGVMFWFIMRSIIRADRTERKVYADIEAEERARIEAQNHAPDATGELS
jgi:flagellar biosynthesis/type III secretory pathway M-ring protein FliF/YscJ